jgi:lysophospholipase L1-like esterase
MRESRKPIIFKILFVLVMLIATIAVLGAAELCVRLLWGDKINLQYTSKGLYKEKAYSSKTDGWLPNAEGSSCGKPVKINSLGLRGPEIKLNDDRKKILLLGDSVLFGIALDEENTIAAILRERLEACIINTSVIGYSTASYVEVLQAWIQKTTLHQALLFFCLNDVQNDTSYVQQSGLSGLPAFLLSQLRSRSKLYMLLKDLISDRSQAYFLNDLKDYRMEAARFSGAMKDLSSINNLCKTNGIELCVILLPYEYQLRNRNQAGIWAPQELIIKHLLAQPIDHLNIDFPNLPGTLVKDLYLYADGIHFSALGHRLIGEQVAVYLSK